MKKTISMLLAASLLWGCSSSATAQNNQDEQVRSVVTSYLDDFKAGDLNGADSYIASDLSAYRLGEALDAMDGIYESLGLDAESIAALKSALTQMMGALISSYQIESVEVEEDTAVVEVKVEGISMNELQTIQSDDFLEAVDGALSAQEGEETGDELQIALDAMVQKIHELDTSSYEATFSLAKEGEEWKIDEISGLMDYQ